MLIKITLACCRGGRFSNSRLGMVQACLRMQSVGILRGLISLLQVASGRIKIGVGRHGHR